jgi:outer membrane protein assembly factor BamB
VGVRRGWVWARRGALAVVLLGAAILPAHAIGTTGPACRAHGCSTGGKIRWSRELPGSWIAQSGAVGTVLSDGEAYVAAGGGVAAIGFGLTVEAYRLATGDPLWTAGPSVLPAFPPGALITSVRSWPGVVTVGVSIPAAGRRPPSRDEVVLSGRSGTVIRVYPAAQFGGAVAASAARTVIVGTWAVTCYDNATGRVVWRRFTGSAAQAWRADGGELYVTVAAGGYLGTAPVTALRRISLQTGAEQVIRPASGPFAGTLSGAVDGVVLFSASGGLTAYNAATGQQIWQEPGVVPVTVDPVRQTLYVTKSETLIGLSPFTGARLRDAQVKGSSGLYEVRNGVALGLDQGGSGDAYGYSLSRHRAVWVSRSLPWPHYFVDLSGLGGSSDQASGIVLVTSCAQLGSARISGLAPPCLRPELVALSL